jgi:PEGA domain
VVDKDARLIVAAFPAIEREVLAQEFRREDASDAAVSAWLRLRYPRDTAAETVRREIRTFAEADEESRRRILVSSLTAMGKLTVTSDPTEATVTVAGIPWDEPTRASRFVDEGHHTIEIAKQGHRTHRGKVTVKKRKETSYNASL